MHSKDKHSDGRRLRLATSNKINTTNLKRIKLNSFEAKTTVSPEKVLVCINLQWQN